RDGAIVASARGHSGPEQGQIELPSQGQRANSLHRSEPDPVIAPEVNLTPLAGLSLYPRITIRREPNRSADDEALSIPSFCCISSLVSPSHRERPFARHQVFKARSFS